MEQNAINVRVRDVTINDFKSVERGFIDFGPKSPDGASVLGVYGQNGSGKTALIDAFGVLRRVLQGEPIPPTVLDQISVDKETARFEWTFELEEVAEKIQHKVRYSFGIARPKGVSLSGWKEDRINVPYITDERVQLWEQSETGRNKVRALVDTKRGNPFGPEKQFIRLTGGGGQRMRGQIDILKETSLAAGTSFIFSESFQKILAESSKDAVAVWILSALRDFGRSSLCVISPSDTELLTTGPLSVRYRERLSGDAAGVRRMRLQIPSSFPFEVRVEDYVRSESLLDEISNVLQEIIPGQRIALEKLSETRDAQGEIMYLAQVVSLRGNLKLPFRFESEGVKKIVLILELLIDVYQFAGFTLAIDELDSGVFEYLLGEILRILDAEGEGQLIFTSHNLRPLEVLDSRDVIFTTTDPRNRYTRMKGVHKSNNLRDMYYRDFRVQESDPSLYHATDNSRIALAMQKAGRQ